jgi:hypothetical protein
MFQGSGRAVVFFLVLNATSPAMAGLFTTALSPDDALQLKHVAVVSVLGDTLHARQIGLTVFQNKSFDASVPDWALDAGIRTYLQEKIAASGRIKGDVEPLVVPTSDRKAILALARDATFDAVIAVLPEQDPNDRLLPPGAGITRRKLPGLDHLHACDGMVVRIWRVADGKQIGYSHPNQCTARPIAGVWHDNWSDFTEEEKHTTLELVRSFVQQQIEMTLLDLRLQPQQ